MQTIMNNYYVIIGIWCFILSTFMAIAPFFATDSKVSGKSRRIKFILYLSSTGLLLSDLCSSMFMGKAGDIAYYGVRISTYFTFFCKYLYIMIFAHYLQKGISEQNRKAKMNLALSVGSCAVGLFLITLSLYRGNVYYFDAENIFYYGSGYRYIQIIIFLNIILFMKILWNNRKVFRKSTFYIFLFYIVTLAATAILDVVIDMWYIQNITIFFSTQLIFMDDMFHLSEKLLDSRKKYMLMEYQAQHDMMTGVWNKKSGLDKIKVCLEQMKPSDTAVLGFIDIDDFKLVNDSYGHEVGDFWIREVAKILKNSCREEDIVCRYGGDEFIIFLKGDFDVDALKRRMDGVRETLRQQSVRMQQDVHCSIGLCWITGAGKNISECIACADAAVYAVKENGKNAYIVYQFEENKTQFAVL